MKLRKTRKAEQVGRKTSGEFAKTKMVSEGLMVLAAVGMLSGPVQAQEQKSTKSDMQTTTAKPANRVHDEKKIVQADGITIEQTAVEVDGIVHMTVEVGGENKQNATYNWFVYNSYNYNELLMDDAVKGKPWTVHVLLNPKYAEPNQSRYIGVVFRNIRLFDGSIGDAVLSVKGVRRPFYYVPGPMDLVDIRSQGEVLYHLKKGTLEPIIDDKLNQNLREVSTQTTGSAHIVVEYGPTVSAVVVSSGTSN